MRLDPGDRLVIEQHEDHATVKKVGGIDPPPTPGKALYGGEYGPWNIPVIGSDGRNDLPTHPDSRRIVDRWYEITSAGININSAAWCPMLVDLNTATERVRCIAEHPDWGNVPQNHMVPWNPDWNPPDDGDGELSAISSTTGECWTFWQARHSPGVLRCGSANQIPKSIHRNDWGDPADVRAKDNGYRPNHACGIPTAAMIVLRAEIEAGYIPHALRLLWNKPAHHAYVPPATKGAGGTGGDPDRLSMGLRFVWDFTDTEIDLWLSTLDVEIREGMRAITVCLREYGAIGCDNGGRRGGAGIWLEHDNGAHWDEIGFDPRKTIRALDGLWQNSKRVCRVVAEPVYPGGDENLTACYPDVVYPDGHRCHV